MTASANSSGGGVEPIAYLRDIDGSGSFHVCAAGDPGAFGVVGFELPENLADALDDWRFNVMLECAGRPDEKIDVIMGGAVLDLRDLHAIFAALAQAQQS